ncbi:MAG: outer membrane lipoprotein-sorting protein [bacterium]|nr:outer membrane lipoprotein-sorting protein [bacterium]
MRKMVFIVAAFLMVAVVSLPQEGEEALTAFDILDKIDQNMVFKTAYSETDMIITIKNRVITKSMKSYALGNEKSYMEFLSPARDKGTKMLKTGEIVKIYYPSAERIMRLSGHMLRRSMMGSDFSYEDMTNRAKKMREEYSGEVKEEETLGDRVCFVLELTSKIKKQTYFTRKVWVDKERFIPLKEERYARSGKLLKIAEMTEIKNIKGRFYPTRMILQDKLRKNSQTEMVVKRIDFDIPIPDEVFSERRLLKK